VVDNEEDYELWYGVNEDIGGQPINPSQRDYPEEVIEIYPLVVMNDMSGIYILDLAAKLDSCAEFVMHTEWSDIITEFPPFFGHSACAEEAYIESLDERTGASLKLTVLNRKGRIWTLVAGGGASVIYADIICDLGFSKALGNYGEYSGAPTQDLTQKYAETVVKLLLESTKYYETSVDHWRGHSQLH